jgi:hypothetical protein
VDSWCAKFLENVILSGMKVMMPLGSSVLWMCLHVAGVSRQVLTLTSQVDASQQDWKQD